MQSEPSKTPEERGGRIESHGRGIGPPTLEDLERRAREIAQIEGRKGDDATEADRARALRELHNQNLVLSSDDARSDLGASSNPADMAVETGHKVPDIQPTDEQQLEEEEVLEGVREAEHERMLEAQRQKEGGDSAE